MMTLKNTTCKIQHRFLLVLVVFFGISQKLLAQSVSISGRVKDKQTSAALEKANVTLYAAHDSSLIKKTTTEKNGGFVIDNIQNGNYYITINFISYKPKLIAPVSANSSVALGDIAMEPASNSLQDITMTSRQNGVNQTLDKQVYKTSLFLSAKGGTALDVIKNLPSVFVNALGELSVRGSDGVQILLNGKLVRGDIDVILSQLPANSIDNIEFITTPSAKLDADGKAATINIITKKETGNGLFLTVNAQGGLPAFHNYGNHVLPVRFGGDATITYNKNKWSFSGAASYLRNDAAGYREGEASTILNNVLTQFPSNGERSFERKNYSLRTAIAFTPNKNNSFNVGLYIGKKTQIRTADLLYNNSKTDLTDNTVVERNTYYNSNLQTKAGNIYLGNLDYTHSFQNKSALSTSFLYEYDDLYGNTRNLNQPYSATADTIQYTHNTNTNPLHGYKASVSYNYSIGKLKVESGYQFRHDNQEGDFIYATNVLHTNDYVIDSAFTSEVRTHTSINAVYTQLSGSSQKFQYTAGLRYEYTHRTLSFTNDVLAGNTLNLSNLFPSGSLLYSLENKWKLKAAYSRRIQRTANFELNPFPEREHSETLEQGDPDLLPTFTGISELGTIKDFTNGSLFITAYYQYIKNPVQRLNSVYNDTILNRIYTNAGTARQFGAEAGITAKPAKWLQLYFGGNVYDYRILGALFNHSLPFQNAGWTYSFNGNLSFVINSSTSLQFSTNYTSRQITAQGYNSAFFSPNLSFKKTFLQGRLNATFQWQNIDLGSKISNRQRIVTASDNFYSSTNYIVEPDVILLNLGFTLKQNNKKIKLPASEFGDKEF